jgi:outer membrane protein OmpA-like peptidoglycan-associated protein
MRQSLAFRPDSFPWPLAPEWESEVSRSSPDYIRWVQSSLNKILGLRLVMDGILGPATRSAIRSFQQRRGLTVNGIVGPKTETALIAAGASTPPGTSISPATGGGVVIMPPLVIQVRPFVILERFDFDRSTFPAAHRPIITRIAHLVLASRGTTQPIGTIRLVGHTDPAGDAAYNLNLGKQRAVGVQNELLAAIDALQPGLSSQISIIPQTLGETRPVATNTTSDGRARNRRVEIFLPSTHQAFLAQYDLRFLPDDPIFGIPANPNMSPAEKAQRGDDVQRMVGELVSRRDRRAVDALARRNSRTLAVPSVLRAVAERLSTAQLNLYREYFPDGAGGIDFEPFQECFEQFTNGELRSPNPTAQSQGVGEPNGGFFFLFAEFAFLCIDSGIDVAQWSEALTALVKTQEIFMHVYRPAPVSAPPVVGAALPTCPVDRQKKTRPRRNLDDFDNSNFKPVGRSSLIRKASLRTKYGGMDVAELRKATMENMLRAQCMP